MVTGGDEPSGIVTAAVRVGLLQIGVSIMFKGVLRQGWQREHPQGRRYKEHNIKRWATIAAKELRAAEPTPVGISWLVTMYDPPALPPPSTARV